MFACCGFGGRLYMKMPWILHFQGVVKLLHLIQANDHANVKTRNLTTYFIA
jgi:hypothetical protein